VTNQTASDGRWVGNDFRVGRILDRTISTYRRNLLQFSLVTLAASAAPLLVSANAGIWSSFPVQARDTASLVVTAVTAVVLALFSQSIIVHGAFQVLRSKPVNLLESAKIGLRRFFPILGLIIFVAIAIFLFVTGMVLIVTFTTSGLGRYPTALLFVSPMVVVLVSFLIWIIVALMLIARWFVVVPICMVERLGPWRSLTRSARLTQGHRWRLVGIILMVFVPALIVDTVISVTVTALGGKMVQLIVSLLWYAIFSAFFAILVVVTYYELRSAKDGADIEQIATVFD
jgi:hypothetical protein